MNDRLYMFPNFMSTKPVHRIFGPEIKAEHFNDDALGRCLDSIYDYGVTKLFSELSFEIGTEFGLLGKFAHIDTTSLSVYGEYKDSCKKDIESKAPIDITYGYSKDGRQDLKQMILNLTVTGKSNLPIWMSSHSGNASDKTILQKGASRIKEFTETLKSTPSFIFVGDSAMYEKCVDQKSDMLWLSRVPNSHKKVKEFLLLENKDLKWSEKDSKGYSLCNVLKSSYKGVIQRWVMVFSEQKYNTEIKTLSNKVKREHEALSKSLKRLKLQKFNCEKDGFESVKKLEKKLKYHSILAVANQVLKHIKKGRPKRGLSGIIDHYTMNCELKEKRDEIDLIERTRGRFILATNQMDKEELGDSQMLKEYKEQMNVESGFRFIKGKAFEV